MCSFGYLGPKRLHKSSLSVGYKPSSFEAHAEACYASLGPIRRMLRDVMGANIFIYIFTYLYICIKPTRHL